MDSIEKIRVKRFKLPLTFAVLAGVLILAMTFNYSAGSVPADAGTNGKKVIVLDAGHGGLDSGCVGINGELEKDINLSIVKNLQQMLVFSGFEVVLTRSEDISLHDDGVEGVRNQKVSDMENRKKVVESYPDCVFLSIHQNQFTQSQYYGAQMFYTLNNTVNSKFAQMMQDNFKVLDPTNNREVKLIDSELYLFKNTTQPALLIECGFLSNEKDAANLGNSDYQKRVAFNIYKTLIEFLRLETGESGQQNEAAGDTDVETESALHMQ